MEMTCPRYLAIVSGSNPDTLTRVYTIEHNNLLLLVGSFKSDHGLSLGKSKQHLP